MATLSAQETCSVEETKRLEAGDEKYVPETAFSMPRRSKSTSATLPKPGSFGLGDYDHSKYMARSMAPLAA